MVCANWPRTLIDAHDGGDRNPHRGLDLRRLVQLRRGENRMQLRWIVTWGVASGGVHQFPQLGLGQRRGRGGSRRGGQHGHRGAGVQRGKRHQGGSEKTPAAASAPRRLVQHRGDGVLAGAQHPAYGSARPRRTSPPAPARKHISIGQEERSRCFSRLLDAPDVRRPRDSPKVELVVVLRRGGSPFGLAASRRAGRKSPPSRPPAQVRGAPGRPRPLM